MIFEWNFILFNIVCVLAEIQPLILNDPDYPADNLRSHSDKYNLRQKFLNKKRQNIATARRIELIDKYLSNKSVFVDGIAHEKIDEKHKQLDLVNRMEMAFRDLIEMNGVNYYYKRDSYWRTWRKVKFPDGDRMICYRCASNLNCTDCQYPGYWAIDESPPCPYEIVSVNNSTDACAIENSTNTEKSCPADVQFVDIMRECDNPIHTLWRVQKSYKKEVSDRYPAIICGGRDYCEISTFYKITRDYVSFRIINSTHHIIYSKIMKNNQTNYACATDCGVIDPSMQIVSKTDKPLHVDLINGKKKRDDDTKDTTVCDAITPTEQVQQSKTDKLKHGDKETAFIVTIKGDAERSGDEDHRNHHHHQHAEKHPTCSSLRHRMEDEMSEEVNTF